MRKNKRKKKGPHNKHLILTSVSFQMGVSFYLAAYFGAYLDEKYMLEKKWGTISLILIALIFSIHNVIKQLKKINNEK